MKEIVGAMIGTIITNRPADIIRGLENNTITRLLSKQEMQLMASFDLGRNWEVMANSGVLFFLDDDGKPYPASLPNKACSRRVPRRGAKVAKSKSKVRVGRTRG